MRMKPQALFYLALSIGLVGLAGCGQKPRTGSSPEARSRADLIENFLLLDEQGEPKAPREPNTGLSPFGAFLRAPEFGARTDCSATHIARGVVVTNAHCVSDYRFLRTSDFLVFFYSNQTGEQVHYPIRRYLYVGSVDYDDIAFLEIPQEAAAEWDIASPQFSKSVRRYQSQEFSNRSSPLDETPSVQPVTLWGFDPLSSRPSFEISHPDRPGMVFAPKHCKSSRTVSWIASIQPDGSRSLERKYQPGNKRLDPGVHLLIDDCDLTTMYGNSGSFVASSDFGQFLGVFHWNLPKEKFSAREGYLGNSRRWQRVWAGDIKGDPSVSVLNIGTAFESILKRTELWSLLPTELLAEGREH